MDVVVRRPGLVHLGICALLVACGDKDPEPPDVVLPTPDFTLVGRGIPTHDLTSDVWVHGTVAYTGMDDVFGSGAPADNLFVWDVSNPATPVLASSVGLGGVGSVVDVKIRADGTLGVIAHEADGITLLDLSNPLLPQIITRFNVQANNTWIEGDYVYAAGDEGLSIIDISNPADPQVVADFYAGISHANDVHVRDGLAFVSHRKAGLFILDVGNGIAGGSPTNPVEVGQVHITDSGPDLGTGEAGDVYTAWYWPDAGYAFVGEMGSSFEFRTAFFHGRLHVVDVSDLSNPMEVATFRVEDQNAPHNLWLDEARGVLYVAWWLEGLQAIDVSGELLGELDTEGLNTQGRRVGSIDVPPAVSPSERGTSWGAQLHDGLVYVSEVLGGLYIFRPKF